MGNPSNSELAQKLGVHPLTVHKWRKAGAPCESSEVLKTWREDRDRMPRENANGDGSLRAARLLKLEREAALLGVKLSTAHGELVPKADVAADMSRISAAIQQRLSHLIGETPTWAGLEPHEIQERTKRFVNETFQLFSDMANPIYKPA